MEQNPTSLDERIRGNHICWTYDSPEDHARILVDFLMDGLARNERTTYYGDAGSQDEIAQRLADLGLDLAALGARNRLTFGDAREAYTPGGEFDPDARLADFEAAAETALADGFTGLRVAAENTWLLDDPEICRAWPAYELRADLLTARMPIIGMCAYDLNQIHHDAVPMIAGLHRSVLGADHGRSQFHLHASAPGALEISGRIGRAQERELEIAALRAIDDLTLAWLDVTDLDVNRQGVRLAARVAGALEQRGELPIIHGTTPEFRRLWRTINLDRIPDAILN